MAQRHRDIVAKLPTSKVPASIVDRENLHSRAPKAQLTKQTSLARRPALDELSSNINVVKPIARKVQPVKEIKPAKVTQSAKVTQPAKAAQPSKKENEPVKSYSSSQIATAIADENDSDPQMVSEYLLDIYQYLRDLETKYPIREDFMEGHRSSTRMRTILVNWLVQVHTNFSLCLETLHLCISIIDRYLQNCPDVGKESLQLVGAAALLVACKYEEMYLPDLEDFVFICDNAFSKEQILKTEISILTSLECNLGKPTSIHFLRRFSKMGNVRFEQHNLAKYLLELALLDHNLSSVRPSLQAAAASCLANAVLSNASSPSKVWTPHLVQQTSCKYSDFKHIVVKFANTLLNAPDSKYQYIQSKYADAKLNKISTSPKLKGAVLKKIAESLPKT